MVGYWELGGWGRRGYERRSSIKVRKLGDKTVLRRLHTALSAKETDERAYAVFAYLRISALGGYSFDISLVYTVLKCLRLGGDGVGTVQL